MPRLKGVLSFKGWRASAWLAALVFGLALASRAWSSTPFVTFDEPAWVYRSVRFLLALTRRDWAGTLLVGHPGVLTMWSGAASLAWHWLVTGAISGAQLVAVDAAPVLDVLNADQVRQLAALLPYAKQGSLLLHAVLAALTFVVAGKALGRAEALVISALLLTDPYLLGLSRVLHIDALTAELMLLTLLALGAWQRTSGRGWLALSAAALALAMLTKAYAGMLLPVGGAWVLAHAVTRPSAGARWPKHLWRGMGWLAAWGGLCGLVAALAWPAVWVNPLTVIKTVLGLSFEYATAPGDATTSFFMGQALHDPGGWFYPVALAFRATPLALLGLVVALASLLPWLRQARPAPEQRRLMAWLLLYALLYLLLISLSRKKFDRYALPALLALDVIAALGLLWAARLLGRRWARGNVGAHLVATLLLVAAQAAWLLAPLAPAYYLAYYNPLAGGAARAQRTLPVGWGEGLEQVGAFLQAKPDAAELTVAAWAIPGLAPYFSGHLVPPTQAGLAQADYVNLYIGDAQHDGLLSDLFLDRHTAEFAVERHGVRYAWLFSSPYPAWLSAQLAETGRAGDGVLVSARSALARRSVAPLTLTAWQGSAQEALSAEVMTLLETLQPGQRLFWVDDDARAPQRAWIHQLLATNALHLWQRPYDLGTVHCYQPIGAARLPQATPMAQPAEFAERPGETGQRLVLRGYALSHIEVQYRQELGISLEWVAVGTPPSDYQVFVHVLDAQGRKWGQRDRSLHDYEQRRTGQWAPGSRVSTSLSVPLQAGIPPGAYRVVMGLYRWQDGRRLTVSQGGRALPGAEVLLGQVTILPPAAPPTPAELSIAHPLRASLAPEIALLGYDLADEPALSGSSVDVTLWIECLAPTEVTALEFALAQSGHTLWREQVREPLAAYPPANWRDGDILGIAHRLALPADLGTGRYDLSVALLDAQGQALAAPVMLTSVAVEHLARTYEVGEIAHPLSATLGNAVELLGYDLTSEPVAPGAPLSLTLHWRALAAPQGDWLVFVHLLDVTETIRGQADGRPAGGARPTNGWLPGEVLADAHPIAVAPGTPPGTLRFAIGMYDSATGERLPAADASGAPLPDGRILLDQTITVAP
jgi:hypothetical protein